MYFTLIILWGLKLISIYWYKQGYPIEHALSWQSTLGLTVSLEFLNIIFIIYNVKSVTSFVNLPRADLPLNNNVLLVLKVLYYTARHVVYWRMSLLLGRYSLLGNWTIVHSFIFFLFFIQETLTQARDRLHKVHQIMLVSLTQPSLQHNAVLRIHRKHFQAENTTKHARRASRCHKPWVIYTAMRLLLSHRLTTHQVNAQTRKLVHDDAKLGYAITKLGCS